MLPRGGDTAEVCIIRVPVRRGYAFAVNDFIIWCALVQGKPQPQRKDLPVGVEGRDNIYSFGHTDHLTTIIQTYVRKINRENSDLTESKNEVLLYSGKIKYNDEISVPNLHKYKLFHLGDNQNELYGCDVGGVVGNVLEFNLSGQVSGRAVFSSIKFHIIKANTLKVIFNIQVNVTADNAIEYVSLERESQITLWGVPLI